MSLPYFYVKEPITGSQANFDEANSKHAIAVLRMQAGERLLITDGLGKSYTGEIISAHKKSCPVRILESAYTPGPAAKISIAISPIKNMSRFEWFLEKATEIGVGEIILLHCQRTEKLHVRMERMQQILVSAMLQSQQVWLPELVAPTDYKQVIQTAAHGKKWIAHCLPESRKSLRGQGAAMDDQILLIGPEGDFTPGEIEMALGAGFIPVELGRTRLRTETAGIVGASFLCIG